MSPSHLISRRRLLRSASLIGGSALLPGWARSASAAQPSAGELSGEAIALSIGHAGLTVDGRGGHAMAVNGTVPGPLIRLREGQRVRIAVTNRLAETASIHWHGLLVPPEMDGVPGVSFPGIPAGQTFTYDFPVRQSGTYWYHSHSGHQEQMGVYGPIVIAPERPDAVASDREYVVVLSDYPFMHPHAVLQRMKQQSGVFNDQRETVADLLAGRGQTLTERMAWARMLMDPTDIADVTGAVLSFLVNGHGPKDNWTGLFRPGERVRLRVINAAAQTVFDLRIPGLKLTVVAADGQAVRPVTVDELQIGNAETYDIIVQPTEDRAYALVAEASDRSGMALATLAPRVGIRATAPPLRDRPLATMKDMGMDMHGMDMSGMNMAAHAGHGAGAAVEPHTAMNAMPGMSMDHAHSAPVGARDPHAGMDMGSGAATSGPPPGMAPPPVRGADVMGHSMSMLDYAAAPQVKPGPGVQMIAPMPQDRTGEPGQGLESVGHRVLTYRDLIALERNPDPRPPSRALTVHLTGNMERFIWGFDGERYVDAKTRPYSFRTGERVRVTLVNDTMMAHPIHLHGHFFELAHGPAGFAPRKHTVLVAPGGKVSWDFTAAEGDWAFHCHMLYHMHAGMFRVFAVRGARA